MTTGKATSLPEPRSPRLRVDLVTPTGWHEQCERIFRNGGRFLALYGVAAGAPGSEVIPAGRGVRALFADPGGQRLVVAAAPNGRLPSLVDLAPAACWDEREAKDVYGLDFAGHEPLRPLVEHTEELSSWTVPVSGHGPHQVAVGPIHAGIIESGHFRFQVVGERILHIDLRLFYKHRGLEAAAEGMPLADGLAYAQRACASCAVSNSVAYAHAVESLLGLWPEPRLAHARTVLLELERVYNHLNDIAAVCAGVGFAPGNMTFAALKERAQRLNRALTGHRFLFNTIAVAGSRWQVGRDAAAAARSELCALGDEARKAWREVLFNASVQDRFAGVGALSVDDVREMGVVGPAARAAGVAIDARTDSPRLAYTGFSPAVPHEAAGDVAGRVEVRAMELEMSLKLLDRLLAQSVEPGGTISGPAEPVGVATVESPRGETVCIVEAAGACITRLHLRTASYANWPALARAAAGEILPDFPLINKSFELCYSCCDR